MPASQTSAKVQLVQISSGQQIAYRRLGSSIGVPLVMHIHYRGNMDYWDPLLIDGLAARRPIIIFDPSGVGRSTGPVADTFQRWGDDIIAFVKALGLTEIDLLGFSMGGAAVQQAALTAPKLIRKLILAGTTASIPLPTSNVTGIVWPQDQPPPKPVEVLTAASNIQEAKGAIAFSFFYDDVDGRAAADAYWSRLLARSFDDEPRRLDPLNAAGTQRQANSFAEWVTPNPKNSFNRLHELKMPVLVCNGDDDVLIPSSRSWELLSRISNAQLIIYPRSGHGFLYQHAEAFSRDLNAFLDA